jgi:hypothetical protein
MNVDTIQQRPWAPTCAAIPALRPTGSNRREQSEWRMEGLLQGGQERSRSRMIGIDLQIRIEEWLTAGLGTAAIRFYGHEHDVDLRELLWVVEF